MIITLKELQKKILLFFYKQGLELFEKNRVLDCNIIEQNEHFLRLNSSVKDDKIYFQDIKIIKNESLKIDGRCSCSIQHNCKHIAASIIFYINNYKNMNLNEIDLWINSFKKVDVKKEFYIYRLIDKKLYLYRSKYLKNGNLSKGRKLKFSELSLNIADEIDKEIFNIFKCKDIEDIELNSKIGNFIIKTLLEYKKLYIEDNIIPPILKKQDYLTLELKKDERYKLKLKDNILYTDRPFIVKNNELIEVDIDFLKFKKVLELEDIKSQDIAKVMNLVLEYFNVNLITPKEIETKIIDTSVNARITLFNEYFKIDFKYADYFISYYPLKDKKEFFEENVKIEIQRKLNKEKSYLKLLEDLFGFKFSKLKNDLVVYLEKNNKNLENWKNFLDYLDKLKEDGWIIENSDDFEVVFDTDSKILVESEDKGGWFELSFDIEINNQKLPLTPIVSSIIEEFEDIELLPKKLYLEVKKNYFAEVESNDLKPIIKTIINLFSKKEKNKLKLDYTDSVLIDETIINDEKLLNIAKKLKNFEGIKEVNSPKSLKVKLRNYQKFGLSWLNFLWEYSFNGILADDMGLGKTLQTIAHLLRLKEENHLKTSLIIVPTSLLANWKNEIEKFAPNLNKIVLYGNERENILSNIFEYDIVITTYTIVTRDIEKLKEFNFYYLILDEAQKIKNARTKVSKSVKLLTAKYKLALSGTPVENHLGELWSIFNFLMPSLLGSYKFFRDYFQIPIEKEKDLYKQELLNRKIKPFILRRTKDKVIKELPSKTEIIKYTQFSPKQAKLYETIRVTMEEKVKKAIEKKGLNIAKFTILDALLKLRQVCCDPRLLKLENPINESAKLELFLEIVDELIEEGRKILVFSQFTSMLDIIADELNKRAISFLQLTGSTKNRDSVIERFKNSDIKIFLISLKAGGVGLNLTEADTVIHYEPWWNIAAENQATDRVYRIGQKKAVFVYKLIVENSIEEKILELQKKKANIQNSFSSDNFDENDLLDLLKG